ncbi:hypothetical protein DINM_022739 [Dirofilaria immitis]|nr:hypothetical protein [Dirofilaria immitis]
MQFQRIRVNCIVDQCLPLNSRISYQFDCDGYDHEATKEAHVKDDNHSGFEKGYEHIGADHGSAHSVWDKITLGEDSDEHAHNHGDWKQAFQYLDKNFSAFLYFA